MAWLYDAAMLVNRGSRYAIATGHVCHLNIGVTQQGFDFSHLLFVQLRLAATGRFSSFAYLLKSELPEPQR